MPNKIYLAKRLFTGSEFLINHAVELSDGCITRIIPNQELPHNAGPIYDIIAPAFIDIQIYGADSKLLSVYPNADSLFRLYDYCSLGGAAHFVATVATNNHDVFHAAIDAVRDYWKEDGKGCLGLHIEGPWINPVKRGAHLEEFIHPPVKEEVQKLLDYGKGVIKIITLAPEVCETGIVEMIQEAGVVVSAGHSNASFEQATKAFNENIRTATHLFNAMSPLQHRAPGFVGAVFNHPTVFCSIVPDGYHVDFEAIKIAYRQLGNRLFAITDAVAETNAGPYPHHLVGDKFESNGILSGSALTMSKALNNLVKQVGIPLGDALKMVSTTPAMAIGQSDNLGIIKTGVAANLVCMNDALQVELLVSPD